MQSEGLIMKKISLVFFIVIIFSNLVYADLFSSRQSLENISKNIPEINSIKCKFKQEKYLNNIPKPLISSGEFEFIKEKGVIFRTKLPFESVTDYTDKSYKQVNDVIKAISSKKFYRIEREFNFYYENNAGNWSLGMKPKSDSTASNYINSIIIEGTDYINKITINQINGNKTYIWFTK